MADTLKEAMAERGLTAADLGAFFGVSEERAAGWVNHSNRFPPLLKRQLQQNFLGMGYDEFQPISDELGSVQYNPQNERKREKERRKTGKPRVRRLRYSCRISLELEPEDIQFINAGRIFRQNDVIRKIVDFGIRKNAARIAAMKKVLGISLDEWTKRMNEYGKGPCYLNTLISRESGENLRWLALANGMSINATVMSLLREYRSITQKS